MRFFATVVTSLCVVSGVFANSLHQFAPRRTSHDTCAELNFDVKISYHKHPHHDFGHINTCVCLHQISEFVHENHVLRAAVKKVGFKTVEKYILHEIEACPGKKKCYYPPHAVQEKIQKCHNPCKFTCNDGFQPNKRHTACICPKDKHIHNGRCVKKQHQPSGRHHKSY